MDNAVAVDEIPSENILEALQDAEKRIVELKESIQVLQTAKVTLNSKEDKTVDDEAALERIQKTLDQELKELDNLFDWVNKLLTIIRTKTYELINRNNSVSAMNCQEHDFKNPSDDSGGFHQVLVVNRDNTNGAATPTIMVLESMTDFEDGYSCENNCCCSTKIESKSNNQSNDRTIDSISCNKHAEEANNQVVLINVFQPSESYYIKLNQDVCKLKEHVQNIMSKNQKLRFQLESMIERNDLLSIALQCPAPFRITTSGEIIFPGKKEMEEKLLLLKKKLIELNSAMERIHINQLRLKSAKELMITDQFNDSHNCQCNCPKENYDTNNVKVKNQQIKYIESQLIEKDEELSRIIIDYESTVQTNSSIIAENQYLIDNLVDLKKQIQMYKYAEMKDVKGELNKVNEDIETMELIVKENVKDISYYDEKLKDVLCDVKEKSEEINKLEDSLNKLKNEYEVSHSKLKSTYQERLENMIALPALLRMSLVKLQEEMDKNALAKETKDKLEREINEEENKKKPARIEDDYNERKKTLETENQSIESRLEYLEENIKSETENLKQLEKALEDISEQVTKVSLESTKHINAFNKFSTIRMEKICNEMQELQNLLTKLQSEECAKTVVKKSAREYLTKKVESIRGNLEKCKLEAITFLDQSNERLN